jgi:hypothetical protein
MNRLSAARRRLMLAGAACLFIGTAGAARADYLTGDPSGGMKKWEFGLDAGVMYPVSGRQFGHQIDNEVLINMLNAQGEGLAEEVAEGFVPPPEPGSSNIASSLGTLPELAAHLDYHVDPTLSVGIQGGWDFRRSNMIDQQGIWGRTWLQLSDQSWMFHVAPVARVGHTFGSVRPSLTFGPEWTVIWEQAEVDFTDPDDNIPASKVVNQANSYFGVVGGVGLEWYCTQNGSLQLGVAYHKVFAPGGKFDYITPQFSLVARF